MNTVICPHCKKSVEISEALRHEFKEKELEKIRAQHEKELEEAKKEGIEASEKKIKQDFELQLKRATEDAEEKDKRIKELLEQMTELTKELRQSKKDKEEAALEMEKKLAQEEEKIRLDAQKKAEEEQHLKILAKDKQLQDTLKELEDAKRKLQQGSQQTQGEVFELEFEKLLQKEFPHDKVAPVGKGVKGGDIIQEVWDARGNYNGKILWELKNTKTWTEGWIDKLKIDKRSINADEAVIISEILPTNMKTAGFREGVWVTQQNFVIGLASALRASLIQLYYAKNSTKGKDEKVEAIYSYLSGVEFKHRIEAIVDAFSNMQEDIEKEKRYFSSKWARDEKNIRQVIDNTFGMHGDFKGLLGNNLPTIKGLEAGEE
ncbi:MAG TPA: DUF2130 domain-containing protein [Patescibacteria group bacterium]|nr:DUF2130 domain-containing protein [Patescibacteria group bacterium]